MVDEWLLAETIASHQCYCSMGLAWTIPVSFITLGRDERSGMGVRSSSVSTHVLWLRIHLSIGRVRVSQMSGWKVEVTDEDFS